MDVIVSTTAKFHSFDLARELLRRGRLAHVFSAYPRRKLGTEGIPSAKLTCYPGTFLPYLAARKIINGSKLTPELLHASQVQFAKAVAGKITSRTAFTGMSGSSLEPGIKAQNLGGVFICRRGSTHIEYQDDLLADEYMRWDMPYRRNDKRIIARELQEYETADLIALPSGFARDSFISKGIPEEKLFSTPYGVDLQRFRPAGNPKTHEFNVVFVGEFSLRKGMPYLLEAFKNLRHPKKKLTLIGTVDVHLVKHLESRGLLSEQVDVRGHVKQSELPAILSRSNVLVLPSVEDGFGVVMAQALACGCPVIATTNTGASDLYSHGLEGYIVRPRSSEDITESLESLAQDSALQDAMRDAALTRVKDLGGWSSYGDRIVQALDRASELR